MRSHSLTPPAADGWKSWTAADFGIDGPADWSVSRATFRGGRREGVDFIMLDNGVLSITILPTRGMGLWRSTYRGETLGWDSPVESGPVHPSFVHLDDRGGLGWLDGFDEWMVRCGLDNNGAPFEEALTNPDGSIARHVVHPLHGRIANIPAHRVEVRVDDAPPHAITIEGTVAESTLFHAQLQLTARITTVPGSNRLTVVDEVANTSDSPGEFQLLYHWNFGPPFLGEGAEFLAPIDALAPRDARAVEGLATWPTYGPPEPGFAEQVYFARLFGDGPEGSTVALLKAPGGEMGVALRFRLDQLPCFTLWKCTRGPREGYVTGLEPATNFPNPKPHEKARGRVIPLAPGSSRVAETTVEVLDGAEAVRAVEAEIRELQARKPATVHPSPTEI